MILFKHRADTVGRYTMKEILAVAFAPLGGKRERESFDILKRNAREVTEVVRQFEKVVVAFFSERDLEKAKVLGRELSTIETKADKGRRDFMRMLHEGAFLPAFRADFARLAERLDNVADTAEGAARAIVLREKLFAVLTKAERRSAKLKGWSRRFLQMARLTTETVETLQASVEALATNVNDAMKRANDVDKLEHEVDIIEQGLLGELYAYERFLDPVSVLQLAEIIRRFGNITDRAEDASDAIAIVAYTIRA